MTTTQEPANKPLRDSKKGIAPTAKVIAADDRDALVSDPNDNMPLWRMGHVRAAAVVQPTPAEYERDAILEQEKREELRKTNIEKRDAIQKGELPPGAQTLEEARAALDRAKQAAEDDKNAKIAASKNGSKSV